MVRTMCALVALAVFAGIGLSADDAPGKAVKAQMVKGTIKSADPKTGVLVVNEKKANNTVVDRELTITKDVEWSIKSKDGTVETSGLDGLAMLVGKEGSVQVKCDKDVKVLKVSVTLK